MNTSERQQGMHAALMVIAAKCERHVGYGNTFAVSRGELNAQAQFHRAVVHALRTVAEAIRVEAMLPTDAMPPVLRADYQPPSEKMDAAKVQP